MSNAKTTANALLVFRELFEDKTPKTYEEIAEYCDKYFGLSPRQISGVVGALVRYNFLYIKTIDGKANFCAYGRKIRDYEHDFDDYPDDYSDYSFLDEMDYYYTDDDWGEAFDGYDF